MRQMDTILVAVGVPTKEVPGASFALPDSVTVTKGTADVPDQTPDEQQVNETQKPAEGANACAAEGGDVEETADTSETAEMGDGWDIPDISDLLDSLNDPESERQIKVRNNIPLTSEESVCNHDTASAFNAQCDNAEDADPDTEHISWSWEDTHWTTEHTHQQKQPNL